MALAAGVQSQGTISKACQQLLPALALRCRKRSQIRLRRASRRWHSGCYGLEPSIRSTPAGAARRRAGPAALDDPRAAGTRKRKGESMSNIEKSIDVEVPVRTAYNQWTQFEEFPRFMEGVQEVTQLDDRRLRWRANV